ncbi:MAG: glycosyltransferase [Saprospiraceae bacterium]|nr:glycosyltransferase [Saprospiraceae bacterium]
MSQSTKIIIVANTTWNIYNFRLPLLQLLEKRGFQIVVIAPFDEHIIYLNNLNEGSHLLLHKLKRKSMNPLQDALLFVELSRLYWREKPDLIIHYTIKPNIYGNIAAFLQGIPSICVITGLGYSFINNGLIKKITDALYRFSFLGAKKVLFENNDDRDLFIKNGLSQVGQSVSTKGYGVDTDYFQPQKRTRTDHRKVFLFIGRLLYDKGIIEFVEAARRVRQQDPMTDFWVLGELDQENLAAVSEDLLTDWIEDGVIKYYGNVADVRPYIADSDVVVLPSYREGMPRAILEGLAMGKAVVTTDTAGCRETVEEGKNGFLVPVRNVVKLIERIGDFCAMPVVEIEKMGAVSRQKALQEFDQVLINQSILHVIEQTLAEKNRVYENPSSNQQIEPPTQSSTQTRLLCLLYYFPPIKSVAVNRNWSIVRYLQPYFTDTFVFTTQNNRVLAQEARDTEGVKITPIPTFDYRTLTAWLKPNRSEMHHDEGAKSNPIVRLAIRLLDSFPFNLLFHEGGIFYTIICFWRAVCLIRREKITHIYSSFRPMSDHFTAHLLKIVFPHLVWIADFRDLHIDPLYQMPIGQPFQHWCNKRLLRRANLVTTVSEGLAVHLRAYHPNVYALRNGVHLDSSKITQPTYTHTSLSEYPKFTLAYTGSMWIDERDPTLLLKIVKKLADEGILTPENTQIVYAGKDTAVWQTWISRYHLDSFFNSYGLVSSQKAVEIQNTTHLNILLTSALPNYGGILTGKFFEYLAACKPVLVLINGAQDLEFEQIITDLEAGIVAYNDRSEAELRAFILKLFGEWQATGTVKPTIRHERLKELSWEATIAKLADVLHLKQISK